MRCQPSHEKAFSVRPWIRLFQGMCACAHECGCRYVYWCARIVGTLTACGPARQNKVGCFGHPLSHGVVYCSVKVLYPSEIKLFASSRVWNWPVFRCCCWLMMMMMAILVMLVMLLVVMLVMNVTSIVTKHSHKGRLSDLFVSVINTGHGFAR